MNTMVAPTSTQNYTSSRRIPTTNNPMDPPQQQQNQQQNQQQELTGIGETGSTSIFGGPNPTTTAVPNHRITGNNAGFPMATTSSTTSGGGTRPLSNYTRLGSPLVHHPIVQIPTTGGANGTTGGVVSGPRSRSYSLGSSPTPMGWTNPISHSSPGSPRSAIYMHNRHPGGGLHHHRLEHHSSSLSSTSGGFDDAMMMMSSGVGGPPDVPVLLVPPPEPTTQQRIMEAASTKERQRIQLLEPDEQKMTADELRVVLKRERHRTIGIVAELAHFKAMMVSSSFEAEVAEEGRVNTLMRRLDTLKAEKERIIIELEREEEMLTNTLQRKLTEVRREKALLEQKIERDAASHSHLSHKHPVPESDSAMEENHFPAIRDTKSNNSNDDTSTTSSPLTPKRIKTTKTEPSITEDPEAEEEEDEGIGDEDYSHDNNAIDMMDHDMS